MKRDADVISEKLHIDEVIDWSDPEPIIREDLLDLVDEANAKMPHPLLHKKAWKRYGHLRWLMDLDLRDPLLQSYVDACCEYGKAEAQWILVQQSIVDEARANLVYIQKSFARQLTPFIHKIEATKTPSHVRAAFHDYEDAVKAIFEDEDESKYYMTTTYGLIPSPSNPIIGDEYIVIDSYNSTIPYADQIRLTLEKIKNRSCTGAA